MSHNKAINHLGRKSGHRKAMVANMGCSLLLPKRIETTVAKAKALRTYVEPLITKSKDDSTHSRRTVFSYLKQKEAVTELFRTIAPKIAERPGGYTRILKTGFRVGDAADMAIIELVDFNEAALASAPKKEAKKEAKDPEKAARKKKSLIKFIVVLIVFALISAGYYAIFGTSDDPSANTPAGNESQQYDDIDEIINDLQ